MMRMIFVAAFAFCAGPAFSQTEKEISCGYQADVVGAVQQARLDRVKERNVEKTLLAGDPSWPENFNAAIPLVAPWVYELPIKQVRNNDLGDVWSELCLSQ
ncbi:MAG: hypothetical protein ABJ360_22860 [Roseobacter sp.]